MAYQFFSDEERELEAVWWQVHGDQVLHVATGILQSTLMHGGEVDLKQIVDVAANLVHEVIHRQEPY